MLGSKFTGVTVPMGTSISQIQRVSERNRILNMVEYQKKPKFMTVRMVAEYVHLSESTIYLLVSENRIPHLKVLNKIRFERDQIDEWMMNHQVKSQLPTLPKF